MLYDKLKSFLIILVLMRKFDLRSEYSEIELISLRRCISYIDDL